MKPDDIRHTRRIFQFNRNEMSKLLCVSYNTIRHWENGTKPPEGLHLDVLRGLRDVAARVEHDEIRKQALHKILPAGIGAFVEFALTIRIDQEEHARAAPGVPKVRKRRVKGL